MVPRVNKEQVEQAVHACLAKLSDKYPGIEMTKEKNVLLIQIPEKLRTTHEERFCKVRNVFLEHLDKCTTLKETRVCILSKYTLLAEARKRALASPFEMLHL